MTSTCITVRKILLEEALTYKGQTLLTYSIAYPEFYAPHFTDAVRSINRYYRDRALEFQRYSRTELFGMAVEQYIGDIENGYPVRTFQAVQAFDVTTMCGCIISLYEDQYVYTGGAHGNTTRASQTWNLSRCALLGLSELVCCPPDFKTYILSQINAQIALQPDIYFEDYEALTKEYLNENSFYATAQGLVLYYQQYEIAPYASGIPTFLLPYSCCIINPIRLCF